MSEQAMKIVVGVGVAMVVLAAFVIAFRFAHLKPVMDDGMSVIQNPIQHSPEEGTMCTMDAKLCSDGSAVGRSGPQCEFAPCPGSGTVTDGFTRCVESGNPVMESYPRCCLMDGTTYTESVSLSAPEPY